MRQAPHRSTFLQKPANAASTGCPGQCNGAATLGGCISTGRAFRRITQRRGSGGSKRQPRVTPGHRSTLAGCISTDRVCRRVLCETRCDLADDATTCLSHCRYAHAGIGEAVSVQVLITGERRCAASNEPTDCDIQHSRSEWTG
jgi:hypothetical protein